jgi:two-component system chemotaxis sensor kinase CheA
MQSKKLGQILIERGDITEESLKKALGTQKRIGEILVETGLVSESQIKSALMEQQVKKEFQDKKKTDDSTTSIRVSSEKLDILVDLVGELVIAQARLSEIVIKQQNPELTSVTEDIERLTTELRDNTLGVRMIPIGSTFAKFKRLVRDLSMELKKDIEIMTDGEETELDKTVMEKLNDPLVHIIRNSIDHGIESPEIRASLKKQKTGIIHLSAYHSGANVFIEISDDGAGLDKNAIYNKAIDKGIITPETELTEKELFALILHPGFSTAQKVTNISGRGVGMDVVKKCIDSLRGTIEITSEKGMGTSITLKLPLTLAIIEGLLIVIGNDHFVIPLSSVEECVELTETDVKNACNRHIINVRGEIVPYIRLREYLHISQERLPIEQVVVTRFDNHRYGFVVDQVIGEHQTVLKNLGRVYNNITGVSGATILGDGTVAVILDIFQIIKETEMEEILNSER